MIEAGIIFLPRLIRARLQAAQEHKASISLARKLRPHHAQEYPLASVYFGNTPVHFSLA